MSVNSMVLKFKRLPASKDVMSLFYLSQSKKLLPFTHKIRCSILTNVIQAVCIQKHRYAFQFRMFEFYMIRICSRTIKPLGCYFAGLIVSNINIIMAKLSGLFEVQNFKACLYSFQQINHYLYMTWSVKMMICEYLVEENIAI